MSQTERSNWSEARSSFKEDQRRAIAEAALAVLMHEGVPGLTMASLAKHAGISRQTLYRYFPDLDSVLAASVEGLPDADAEFRETILSQGDPRDQLRLLVDSVIDVSGHGNGGIETFLAALPPEARAGVQAHRGRTVNLISDILMSLKRRRRSTYSGDPHLDAELILGLISAADDRSRARAHQVIDLFLQ